MEDILIAALGAAGTLTIALIKQHVDKKRINLQIENLELINAKLRKENADVTEKLQFLDRILDLEFINSISDAVDNIFEKTKADRFLIMIAKNGSTDFNIMNVVFELFKTKEMKINAIARYRNVHVDHPYKQMLKEVEYKGTTHLETETMEDNMLKLFYENDGVKFSEVRHLSRKPIDAYNDFLMFSELSTKESENFTANELAYIKNEYEGTIMPALKKVMD